MRGDSPCRKSVSSPDTGRCGNGWRSCTGRELTTATAGNVRQRSLLEKNSSGILNFPVTIAKILASFADYSGCSGRVPLLSAGWAEAERGILVRAAEMLIASPSPQTPAANLTAAARLRVWVVGSVLFVAMCSGCTSLGPGALGTQPPELASHPNLAPIMDGPQYDERGNLVASRTAPPDSPPSELAKVTLPRYRVAAPDILMIQGVRLFPKSPYFIQAGDYLQIVVPGLPLDQPIQGTFQVDSQGMVNLGASYDSLKVTGMTLDEAQEAIAKHMARLIPGAQASVSLLQASGIQQVQGEHLIGPDGYINLGIYGSVYVQGMTVDEVRLAIEKQLSNYMDQPSVSVDVLIYNSKFFYIVMEGAGLAGESVMRIPTTGNECVLDAISQIGGLQQISSKRIWIARPAPKDSECDQILPVDWVAITRNGSTATNYQILPGDRIFVAEDRLLATRSIFDKVINPVERIMGFTLLSSQTIQYVQRFPRGSLSGF